MRHVKYEGNFSSFALILAMWVAALSAIALGLMGFFDYNVISELFGCESTSTASAVFVIVTLLSLYALMPGYFTKVKMSLKPFGVISLISLISILGGIYLGITGLFYYDYLMCDKSQLVLTFYDIAGIAGVCSVLIGIRYLTRKK